LNDLSLVAATLALPLLTFYLTIAVRFYDGALVIPDRAFLAHIELPDVSTLLGYAGWIAFQAVLLLVLPGRVVKGPTIGDGSSFGYKLNGAFAFFLTVAVAIGAVLTGRVSATILYDQLVPLLGAANLGAFVMCVYVFVLGRRQAPADEPKDSVAEGFFMGTGLNPRNGSFDWKFFSEARPGMILWVLLDLSMAATQYAKHGVVSNGMILACVFQAFYVADCFVLEEAMLSTWDFRYEKFGFMLAWGCLVFIPFTFSLQTLYLVNHPEALPVWAVIGLVVFNFSGYFIFRTSNLQKHRFRKDPTIPIWGRTPEAIQTARGTKLLVSGWWGIARHANYLGDLMMGLAWCLTTASRHVLPYFYFIYFVILLVHRERRDHDHCAKKYGKDWDEYTRRVRWRIVPGLY
jgi:protein-S-isoprenylcysteine O-methyltransferase Ste14